MTKQEFLEKLRLALTGNVPGSVVSENLQYYEDYINTEIRKGKSEEEVLAALGDPRLIARTIITTNSRDDMEGTGDYTGNRLGPKTAGKGICRYGYGWFGVF